MEYKEIAIANKEMDVLSYLPPVIQGVQEYQAIAAAENPALQKLWYALDGGLKDQFVQDATIHGVRRMESILAISPKGTESIENRKRKILARINETLPYTYRKLENWLLGLCNKGSFSLELLAEIYELTISLEYINREFANEIFTEARKIVPANMNIRRLITIPSIQFENNFVATLYSIHFGMNIKNLGIEYVTLEGTHLLDGNWDINFITTNVKLRYFDIKTAVGNKLISKQSSGVIAGVLNRQYTNIFMIYLTSIQNLNETYSLIKNLEQCAIQLFWQNKYNLNQVMHFMMYLNNRNNIVPLENYRCNLQNCYQQKIKEISFVATIQHVFSISTKLVMDTLWYLEGAHSLDGGKKLNAGVYEFKL